MFYKSYHDTWPKHCEECKGWGGHVEYENHGPPWGLEPLWEICEYCIELGLCPRCEKNQYSFRIRLFKYIEEILITLITSSYVEKGPKRIFKELWNRFPYVENPFEDPRYCCIECNWNHKIEGSPEGFSSDSELFVGPLEGLQRYDDGKDALGIDI